MKAVDGFEAELRSLAVGSLPHLDPAAACELVLRTVDIPTWPQLPRRTFLENMYVQFSERFPGVVVRDERIYVDRGQDLDPGLEQLYVAYLLDDLEFAAISPTYAAGLHCFLELDLGQPARGGAAALKGQVTGPVSWGLVVADQDRRPVLYDDVLAEAVAKHLRLKASWIEQELHGGRRRRRPRSAESAEVGTDARSGLQTIIFVDEPYMSSFGSAFVSLSREQVISFLEETFAGIQGLKGVHCCGNTDWSLLLSTSVNILNLDAYGYAGSLALYPDEVGDFLQRGGMIAWGIVPASDQAMTETVESLVERFYEALGLLTAKGLHLDDLLSSALITPSCGCGSLEEKTAERVLELTGAVSEALRERWA